jgi:hypothetical protein
MFVHPYLRQKKAPAKVQGLEAELGLQGDNNTGVNP